MNFSPSGGNHSGSVGFRFIVSARGEEAAFFETRVSYILDEARRT